MTITESKLEKLLKSPEEAARIADLVYVKEEHLTICRKKKGKGFTYCKDDKIIKSKPVLNRINKLVIPPAWQDVLISEPANGHLQVVKYLVEEAKPIKTDLLHKGMDGETAMEAALEVG